MEKILLASLFLLLINSLSFAQTPRLLDQFPANTSLEQLLSRLDYLTAEISENENSLALIKVYGERKNLQGFPYRYAAMMKAYLTNNRRLNGNRIITQQCNGGKEATVDLLLVLSAEKVDDCEKSLIVPETTTRFDSYHYSFEYPEFDDCCSIAGGDTLSAEASLKAFSELLAKSNESRAYVISYNGTNIHWINNKTIRILDSAALGKATTKSAKDALVKNGVESSRITIINGGYKDSTRNVELWFVPKGGEIPKPKPDYFPKKKLRKKK